MSQDRSPSKAIRSRYKRLSGRTQTLLRTEGESGRFEFKQDANAVQVTVLVAAANTAAIERLESVTVLVGVAEEIDPETGIVTGKVIGLDDVESAARLISSRASNTRPIPVGMLIVHENLETSKPILRLEIRPTRPPHYSDAGHRVTRQGATTRAITDEELVGMYLEREAASFQARFRQTASEILDDVQYLQSSLEAYQEELERTREGLTEIHALADEAASASDSGHTLLEEVSMAIGNIETVLDDLSSGPETFEEVYLELRRARSFGLMAFKGLAKSKPRTVKNVLSQAAVADAHPLDYAANRRELKAWRDFISAVQTDPNSDDLLSLSEQISRSRAELDPEARQRELEEFWLKDWWKRTQ